MSSNVWVTYVAEASWPTCWSQCHRIEAVLHHKLSKALSEVTSLLLTLTLQRALEILQDGDQYRYEAEYAVLVYFEGRVFLYLWMAIKQDEHLESTQRNAQTTFLCLSGQLQHSSSSICDDDYVSIMRGRVSTVLLFTHRRVANAAVYR